jgi:hypothetical protein
MAIFFLPLRIGSVPFPISALLSGALNALLVWVALQWTSNPRVAALPVWAWLLMRPPEVGASGSVTDSRPR